MDWKTEIETGPLAADLAPHVAAGDDGAVVALLNAKTIDAVRSVSRPVFVRWAAKAGMRAVIQDVASVVDDPLRSSALALLDIIQGGGDSGLDFTNADNLEMLDVWVAFGKLTQQNKDGLLALATVKISRSEQVAGRDATIYDVANALRNEDGTAK